MESETGLQCQYQTLCGSIFYLDNKSFAIACTLCEQQFMDPEDFFGHILADHVYDGNTSTEESTSIPAEDERETENDEEMETVYLEEEYAVEDTEGDQSKDYVDVVYNQSATEMNDPVKYAQLVQNFIELEPILGSISKCHWIWDARADKPKLKNSSLRFLRHKYYLAHRSSISAKDLEYKIKLLRSMRRLKCEVGLEDEYMQILDFFNNKIYNDLDQEMLECPEEGCGFITVNEEEICQHILESHFVPDEKIYKCSSCDMKTKTYKTYLKHSKTCCSLKLKSSPTKPDEVNMQCLTCGEQLGDDIEVFNQHMRQHNKIVKKSHQSLPAQPLKLETRKITVQSSKGLKRPVPKPIIAQDNLECDICGLTLHFTEVEKFNEHMRMHNKIQLFKCRVCKKIAGNNICEECSVRDNEGVLDNK